MPKKKKRSKKSLTVQGNGGAFKDVLSLYAKIADLKKEMDRMAENEGKSDDRLTSLEVHVNVLARLLTTLCIEKFGMRVGALKRLVRRVEKEAVRDSQIMELEFLYRLSHGGVKKTPSSSAKPKDDPWEQIS